MLSQAPRVGDIRNFIIVLLSGMVVACAIVGAMAYFYSPSGRYWSHNVLLAPEVVEGAVYNDVDPLSRKVKRYIFERVEFTYYDKGKWTSVTVSNDSYEKFWKMVEGDWSLAKPAEDIPLSFQQAHSSYLSFWVRPDPAVAPVKVFQQIDFAPTSGFYRVELRSQSDASDGWVYFEHPYIYRHALDLFVAPQ